MPKEVTVSGRKQQVNAVSKVVMKVNVAGQTKNFSAVSTLEAWDTAGNVLMYILIQTKAKHNTNSTYYVKKRRFLLLFRLLVQ